MSPPPTNRPALVAWSRHPEQLPDFCSFLFGQPLLAFFWWNGWSVPSRASRSPPSTNRPALVAKQLPPRRLALSCCSLVGRPLDVARTSSQQPRATSQQPRATSPLDSVGNAWPQSAWGPSSPMYAHNHRSLSDKQIADLEIDIREWTKARTSQELETNLVDVTNARLQTELTTHSIQASWGRRRWLMMRTCLVDKRDEVCRRSVRNRCAMAARCGRMDFSDRRDQQNLEDLLALVPWYF